MGTALGRAVSCLCRGAVNVCMHLGCECVDAYVLLHTRALCLADLSQIHLTRFLLYFHVWLADGVLIILHLLFAFE
jgi:hypothetical protein